MFFPSQKNLFRIRLLLLLGTVLILAIVFIDIYSNESQQGGWMGRRGYKASMAVHREQLLKADELLHSRLWQLQSMDQQFSALLTSGNDVSALNATDVSIQKAEQEFKKSIDSINRAGKQYDALARTNDFQNMTEFFNTILENRRFLAYIRLGSTSADKESAGYLTVLKLQEELQRKDKLLAADTGDSIHKKEKADLQNAIAAKDKQIQDLQTESQKGQAEKQSSALAMQQLQAELAEKNKAVAAAATNLPAGQKASLALQNDLTSKTQQIRNLEAKIRSIEADQQAYSQALQNSLTGMQTAIAEKNEQIRKLQAAILKEQAEKKAYSQRVQNQQLELVQKNKLIIAANNKNSPADPKATANPNLQREIAERDTRIRNLQSQLQQLQARTQATKPAVNESIRDLQKTNTNLKVAYSNTLAELGLLTRKYNALKSENDQLRSNLR